MKYLHNYKQYINENLEYAEEMVELIGDINILESIVTDSDSLLKSIEAKEENIYNTFELSKDAMKLPFTIEDLYKNKQFNSRLKKLKLRKSQLEETDDSETFIRNVLDIKFFLIHDENKSQLDKPRYIIFQAKSKVDSVWNDVKLYSVNGDIKNFYDKLTNKTIELKKNDNQYIYFTSNSGNNWQLQNTDKADSIFLDLLDKEQIKMLLKDKDVLITIIA